MSIPWRLWEMTLCRINNWGHAAFDPGELEMLVCGAAGASERKALHRGFKTLIELSRISPDSTKLCVVVNDDLWRRGAGRGSWEDSCSEPAHRAHRRHVWSAAKGWDAVKRVAAKETITVPVVASDVPVWGSPVDQWPPQVPI
jgi:hypothetical protein